MSTALLEAAAAALGPMTDRVVFLGGATVGIWFTDPAARPPRVTYDVDVVAKVVTLAAYADFQANLRARHFHEDVESGVICRWRHNEARLILDAVPVEAKLAGFGGQWLRLAAAARVNYTLPSGIVIRVVPPAYLLATKLEAFADRGHDDCLASKDFEDIMLLVDSREELLDEVIAAAPELGSYISTEVERLLGLPSFTYGAEGALAAPDARPRLESVTLPRLQALTR